jgi:hypothetical protein
VPGVVAAPRSGWQMEVLMTAAWTPTVHAQNASTEVSIR